MEKIIVTYSAPDGEDVHGEKSAEYCVGCAFFNGGYQESIPGAAKGYGTCCPDVSTGLPRGSVLYMRPESSMKC